ncbi:MAG TPA: TIGR03118 family protein, partial [Ramlibacter sp.]|nr:TIGR03118 family protein [Ramlibacter sp.]
APFIFVGENGTVSGWAPSVNATASITMFDGSSTNKVYKGLAIASFNGANYLYAADFHNGKVDVFNGSYAPTTLPGGFANPGLPAGYAPFGIQAIGDRIYVAYTLRAATSDDGQGGPGVGVVAVFDTGGTLIKQLAVGGALNAPWGMAMAPANFGAASGALLVGNFGDGMVNAFDPATGNLIGSLGKADGTPIVIDGLWGIAFGNDVKDQPSNTLFFASGPADEAHGLYGRVDLK